MEPEVSLPCSQEPAIGPCPEPGLLRRLASEEVSCLLWKNSKFRYRVHMTPALDSKFWAVEFSQPPHTLFLAVCFNIILPSTPGLASGLFSLDFPTIIFYAFFTSPMRTSCSISPPWLVQLNIWWTVQVMKLLITQSSPVSRNFFPLTYKYSLQLPVLRRRQSAYPLLWETKLHAHRGKPVSLLV